MWSRTRRSDAVRTAVGRAGYFNPEEPGGLLAPSARRETLPSHRGAVGWSGADTCTCRQQSTKRQHRTARAAVAHPLTGGPDGAQAPRAQWRG